MEARVALHLSKPMANIVRQSLSDRVYDHLVGLLASKTLKIGSRINPRSITEELSVSRTTVNKAIEAMIKAGWLKTNEKGRPIVSAYPPKQAGACALSFDFANQTDSSYEVILERIQRGDYVPGEVFKERPLANELGVNPATVRRAAEWLRNDGFLIRLPRRGWRVVLLEACDIKDIYQVRLLLEPLAVQGAAHRISEETLDELERECDLLIERGEKATVYDRRTADQRFHRTLWESSGSRVLADVLYPLVRKLMLITTVRFRYGRTARSYEEHKQIISALRRRDAAEAVSQMRAHLRTAMKCNLDAWERPPSVS